MSCYSCQAARASIGKAVGHFVSGDAKAAKEAAIDAAGHIGNKLQSTADRLRQRLTR